VFSLALIGAGNLGQALLECTCGGYSNPEHPCEADQIIVVESDAARCVGLREFATRANKPVSIESCITSSLKRAGVIVLAVKPQDYAIVAKDLALVVEPSQLVVSVMAGVSIAAISSALGGHGAVIRCMPNLPARIGKAITVYYSGPTISGDHRFLAEHLLSTIGEILEVHSEELLASATAISGSGPGYIYYLAQHMVAEAIVQGFTPAQAVKLVCATWGGAIELWQNSDEDPAKLLSAVTSKGGTTAAAVAVFEQAGVGAGLRAGVARACARAVELSQTKS